jgi:predicted ribosome quality control (RQC) complex YloA/Tae2 family protein
VSFNYLEIQTAVQEIRQTIEFPALCIDLKLMSFPVSNEFNDLNIGFKIFSISKNEYYWIIFSLKSPWLGLFCYEENLAKNKFWILDNQKLNIKKIFSNYENLKNFFLGKTLIDIKNVLNERVVEFYFKEGEVLSVLLFGNNPKILYEKYKIENDKAASNEKEFKVRNFSESLSFIDGAYFYYLNLRNIKLKETLVQKVKNKILREIEKFDKIKSINLIEYHKSLKADEWQKKALALKENFYLLKDKKLEKEVCLNFTNENGVEEKIVVELDLKKSLSENLNFLFNKSKKLLRAQAELKERISFTEKKLEKLNEDFKKCISYENQNFDLIDFDYKKVREFFKNFKKEFLIYLQNENRVESKNKENKDFILPSFLSKEGLKILCGRNAKENEMLVMKIAKPNDIWMHLKGRPSAHVIIQVPKNKTASLDTLLDAANLCLYFSKIDEGEKMEVDYTYRKYVKRISSKSKTGETRAFNVQYTQNKTLIVQIEKPRLARLL